MTRVGIFFVVATSLTLALGTVGCTDDPPDPGPDGTGIDTGDVPEGDGGDAEPDRPDPGPDEGPDVPDEGPDTPLMPGSVAWNFLGTNGSTIFVGQDTIVLTLEHDREPATPGVQLAIRGTTEHVPAGTSVEVTADAAALGSSTVEASGNFELSDVSVGEGADQAVCVATTGEDGVRVEKCKTVTVLAAACTVELLEPAEGCLEDADEDTDGLQVQFVVESSAGGCTSAEIVVTVDGTALPVESEDLDGSGQAVFLIELAGPGEEVDAAVGVDVTAVHPDSSSLNGTLTVDEGLLYVDTVPPLVTIEAPDGDLVLGADDLDSETPGLQTVVSGTVEGAEEGAEITLWIEGTQEGTSTVGADGSFAFGEVTFTSNGTVQIDVQTSDACGNVGAAGVSIGVFATNPNLVLLTPADGEALLAKDDGEAGTATVYETSFEFTASGVVDGQNVVIECRPAAGPDQTFFDVSDPVVIDSANPPVGGTYVVDVALDVSVLGQEVVCRAAYAGPVPGFSPAVSITVGLPAPTLTLLQPTDGLMSNDATVTFVAEGTGLDGQGVMVWVTSPDGVPIAEAPILSAGTFVDGLLTEDILLTADGGLPLPGGQYLIQVDAMDAWGNVISDLGAAPTVAATFDFTAPQLALNSPSKLFLDPVGNPGDAEHEDAYPGTPGFQQDVVVSMNGEVAFMGAEVCLSVGGDPLGCQDVAADFTVTWPAVTFTPGTNSVALTGVDAFGNTSSETITVTLQVDTPVVTIVTPPSGTVTTEDAVDVTVSVADPNTSDPLPGQTVTLTVNGADSGVASTDNGDGTYTFVGVTLADGANQLQALVDVGGEIGASAIRTVTKKVAQPTIALTFPGEGALFNLASPECPGVGANCTLTVTGTVADVEEDSDATLTVDCGEPEPPTYAATTSNGDVSWPAVTLVHGGTCELTATVTDAAAQVGTSDPVTVTVDRVGPSVSIIEPDQAFLLWFDDLNLALDGMQHPLQISVGGVEAGQELAVEVRVQGFSGTCDDACTEAGGDCCRYTNTIGADVAEGNSATVNFGAVTYPNGDVTIEATIADAAGNPGSGSASVSVEAEVPSVSISGPTYPGATGCASCAASAVCVDNECRHKWGLAYDGGGAQFTLAVGGFQTTTDNVRLCSDHPDFAASGAPLCASGDGSTYRRVVLSSVSGSAVKTVSLAGLLPEGQQTIVAELLPVQGEPWVSSLDEDSPLSRQRRVLVDLTAPVVTGLSSPSDGNGDGFLNIAEQDGGVALTYLLQVDTEQAETGSVTFYANSTQIAMTPIDGASATIAAVLPEGANEMYARVSDIVGNLSPGEVPALKYNATVDVTVPEVSFDYPNAVLLNASDSTDVVVDVNLTAGEEASGATVTLFDGGAEIAQAPVVGGKATFAGVITGGDHTYTATAMDPAGNTASAATTPGTVTVDLSLPTATILSPPDGVVITTDAEPGTPGFQVTLDFTVGEAGGDVDWEISSAECTDNFFTTCAAPDAEASGTVTGEQTLAQTITVTLAGATTFVQVTLTATDEAGNVQTAVVNLPINIEDCIVEFVALPPGAFFNAAACLPATSCDIEIQGTATGCGGSYDLALLDGAATLQTLALNDGDTGTFTITVADAQTLALQLDASVASTSVGASQIVNKTVDITAPVVTLVSSQVLGFTTPAAGASETYNADDDQDAAADFQMHAFLTVVDTHPDGVLVEVSAGGSATTTGSVTGNLVAADTLELTVEDVTLPDLATSTVVFTASDEAGNTATSSFDATVDTVPPGDIDLTISAKNERLPSLTLSWDAPGDDGDQGTASFYSIRYSKSPITEANYASACSFSNIPHTASVPSPAAAGTPQTYVMSGPSVVAASSACKFAPTEAGQTYYVAIRARDDVNNLGPVTALSVASDTLALNVSRVVFSTTFRDDVLGGDASRLADMTKTGRIVGDVDNDGFPDMVVGGDTAEAFCVLYGADTLPDTWTIDSAQDVSTPGVQHDCVADGGALLPSAAVVSRLGDGIRALGDVNGDGLADFGVSGMADGFGFVLVYLGVAGGPDLSAPDVTITGLDGSFGSYSFFCGAGNFTGESGSGGAPIDTIALGAPALGRIDLLPGTESWASGGSASIDLLLLDSEQPLLRIATTNGLFGSMFGYHCASTGNLLPTPGGGGDTDDLAVAMWSFINPPPPPPPEPPPPPLPETVHVFPGRPIAPGLETIPIDAFYEPDGSESGEDALVVRLRQASEAAEQFGIAALQGIDVNADGTPDLVVGQPSSPFVFVFDGNTITAGQGQVVKIGDTPLTSVGQSDTGAGGTVIDIPNGQTAAASAVVAFDWDGWQPEGLATPELLVMSADESATVQVLTNHQKSPNVPWGSFPYIDTTFDNEAGGTLLGWVDGGADLSGDGLPDLVTGSGSGTLVIIR